MHRIWLHYTRRSIVPDLSSVWALVLWARVRVHISTPGLWGAIGASCRARVERLTTSTPSPKTPLIESAGFGCRFLYWRESVAILLLGPKVYGLSRHVPATVSHTLKHDQSIMRP